MTKRYKHDHMAEAHKQVYSLIHSVDNQIADPTINPVAPAKVSIAHSMMIYSKSDCLSWPVQILMNSISKFSFLDRVIGHLDFLGVNYYGEIFLKGLGMDLSQNAEYSENGITVNPNAFAQGLLEAHERYNIKKKGRKQAKEPLHFFITENGIGDESDIIRPAYIIEHLKAISYAQDHGVPVDGFLLWTITDNWEWHEGYCPKFGLVAVDRANGFKRMPRSSFYLFSSIAKTKKVTQQKAEEVWSALQSKVSSLHPFCHDPSTGNA